MERAELAVVVRAAIADLGERQRTALELHQFHDQTYAEVAAQLDMTPKAAKSLLYRTRNLLRAADADPLQRLIYLLPSRSFPALLSLSGKSGQR